MNSNAKTNMKQIVAVVERGEGSDASIEPSAGFCPVARGDYRRCFVAAMATNAAPSAVSRPRGSSSGAMRVASAGMGG